MMTSGERQIASLVCVGIAVSTAEANDFSLSAFFLILSVAFFILSFFNIPEKS